MPNHNVRNIACGDRIRTKYGTEYTVFDRDVTAAGPEQLLCGDGDLEDVLVDPTAGYLFYVPVSDVAEIVRKGPVGYGKNC